MVKDVTMQRARTYRTRATDLLSAFLLCLAAILAGTYTPLSTAAPSLASSPAPATGGIDARDQRSSPTTPERPFVAGEWRIAKAALTQGEGKSKAALPPASASLPVPASGPEHETSPRRAQLSPRFHGYGARAPPASS
jgi:hypothetical protein